MDSKPTRRHYDPEDPALDIRRYRDELQKRFKTTEELSRYIHEQMHPGEPWRGAEKAELRT